MKEVGSSCRGREWEEDLRKSIPDIVTVCIVMDTHGQICSSTKRDSDITATDLVEDR